MTTVTEPEATVPSPDRTGDAPPIPLHRLVLVELRKLVDTRAGFWLTASIAVLAAVVVIVMLAANRSDPGKLSFSSIVGTMNIPTGVILPIMAILLVTGEWSQRNALTTFTMEPRRERVVAAKLGASLIAAVAAVLVALILGAIGTLIAGIAFGDPAGSWTFSMSGLLNAFIVQILSVLLGFGFAALFLSTPAAIVAYFALPMVMSVVSDLVPAFGDKIGEWVNIDAAQTPLLSAEGLTGGEWSRLVVATLIWVGIPLTFGIARIMRSEVK